MKKFVLGLVIILASFAGVRVPVLSVQPLVQIREDGPTNVCTGFSINRPKGYWLTANHCWFEGALFHGRAIEWVAFDEKVDLAIFVAESVPSLKLAIKAPNVGDDVLVMGYPYGALDLLTFFGRVSHPNARLSNDLTALVLNIVALPGTSGGPILDTSGRVVGVAQNSNRAGAAWSVPWVALRNFGQAYWEVD